jgi:hypothetical protein
MDYVDPAGTTTLAVTPSPIRWGGIIAGALVAAAVSFVLLEFAAAIGLSVSSTSPTWRGTSIPLWILSGIFLVFVSLASFGTGGYVSGRLQAPAHRAGPDTKSEIDAIEFFDGLSGLVTWGLAVLIGALLALVALDAVAPSANAPGVVGASSKGELLLTDELDKLFRSNRRPADVDLQYRRAEAARILMTASGQSGVSTDDKDYLSSVVESRTGVEPAEADQRVGDAISQSKMAIARARAAMAIEAFAAAAALIIGAAVAWFAAIEGGRDRESRRRLVFSWTPWRKTGVVVPR